MRGLSLACAAACVLATLATAAFAGGSGIPAFAPPHGGGGPSHGGRPAFGPHGGRAFGGPVFGGRFAHTANGQFGLSYSRRFERSYGWGAGLGYAGGGYAYPSGGGQTIEVSSGPIVVVAPIFGTAAGPEASALSGPRIIFVNRDRKAAAAPEKLPQLVYGDAPAERVGGPKVIYGDSWN